MTQLNSAAHKKGPRYVAAELDQFAAAHERWVRRQAGGCRAILHYVQAEGHDFSSRILSGADFTGAAMRGARFVRTHLERACLYMADLRAIDGQDAKFAHADLRGASLREAILTGAVLDHADLGQAMLAAGEPAQPTSGWAGGLTFNVDFTGCSMKGTSLARSRLVGANFEGANLAGANITGADLRGGRFTNAVLTGVNLAGVMLDPGALEACIVDPSPEARWRAEALVERLAMAELWFSSDGATGRPAVLSDEDLRPLGGALADRRLPVTCADRALAIGVSFAGSQLQGASFQDADLRDADFTGADLRGASFRGANVRHACFKDADLRPLPLAGGGARLVDLTGADHVADAFALAKRL